MRVHRRYQRVPHYPRMVPGIVLKFRAIITVQAGEFDTLLSNTIDAMAARFAKPEVSNVLQFAAE